MATLTINPASIARSITPPLSPPEDSPSPMALALAVSTAPLAIPNKHLPTPTYTITTKVPTSPVTPPASPPTEKPTHLLPISTILYPPSAHHQICAEPPIFSIDAATAAAAIHQNACHPLPSAEKVFPWLHGLHSENTVQLTFFNARRKIHQRTPSCWRGVTVVKAGRALDTSKLRGAVHPAEILSASSSCQGFLEVDPKDGFCVRNFHIQTAKLATVSDIIVYGDDRTSKETVKSIAKRIAQAQVKYRSMFMNHPDVEYPQYNTFVVSSSFAEFEQNHSELVAFDSKGLSSGSIPDFPYLERQEMCTMSRATEITHNVWLGSTTDKVDADPEHPFNICIEACDGAPFPTAPMLRLISRRMKDHTSVQDIEFPASGSVAASNWAKFDIDFIIDMCRWIYFSANPIIIKDADGDTAMDDRDIGKKVLIHCMDGYTETSLLALAYIMYAEGLTVHDAWIQLHREKGRNFFAYQTDLQILLHAQNEILRSSPARKDEDAAFTTKIAIPKWVSKLDGSLPSRILPHMYLGNLGHANNPEMLKQLGINRILSVGEFTSWSKEEEENWPVTHIMRVENLQDNGVDPLTCRLNQCLAFIDEGRQAGEATLVHCRVGVSRSATICIAEVMKRLKLSVPRAYCYVRARRLNVIIQPHLRFMYELLKWEEAQRTEASIGIKREIEWPSIAREIALMNRPYSR